MQNSSYKFRKCTYLGGLVLQRKHLKKKIERPKRTDRQTDRQISTERMKERICFDLKRKNKCVNCS